MTPQLQPAERARGHGPSLVARRELLRDPASEVLEIKSVSVAFRAGRADPVAAPALHLLAVAEKRGVGKRNRDRGKVAGFAQRGVPAMLVQQLLDVAQVARQHS